MVAFTKYNTFIDQVSKGGHNLQTCVVKCALTNTAPTVATDTVWSTGVYPPPAAANGYTAGGNSLTTSSATTVSGTFSLICADTVFTASGGAIGPFRYVILYNSSATNLLIGSYDYGSNVTLNNTENFTVDFDNVVGVLTLA
jgi:hypothetical protein